MAIEATHYREEVQRLVRDEQIQQMAFDIQADGYAERFLADPNAMNRAYHEANKRGIKFESIGGPHRAIVAILESLAEREGGAR